MLIYPRFVFFAFDRDRVGWAEEREICSPVACTDAFGNTSGPGDRVELGLLSQSRTGP